MVEKTLTRVAELKLDIGSNGRLKKSVLAVKEDIDNDADTILSFLIEKKDRLLRHVRAKIPLRVGNYLYIPLKLRTQWDAEVWKLDAEEEIHGLAVGIIDQNGHTVEVSRQHFANPQYF